MADSQLVLAFFNSEDLADKAVAELKEWDKASDDIKLGAIGVLVKDEKGKIKTQKLGSRAGGKGARTGIILGVIAAILSGGVTLIGGIVGGALAGGIMGSLFHRGLGLSKQQLDQIGGELDKGRAAVGIMVSPGELLAVSAKLKDLGGKPQSYALSAEAVEQATQAAEAQPAEPEAVEAAPPVAAAAAVVVAEAQPEAPAEPVVEAVAAVAAVETEEVQPEASAGQAAPQAAIRSAAIADVRGVTAELSAKLAEEGIKRSADLLVRCQTPVARRDLARTLGIEPKDLLELANRADLIRIRGVAGVYSDLLENAGVDTVSELARRVPSNLQATLAAANADLKLTTHPPTLEMVTEWVDEAKTLPRMLEY